MIDFKNIEGMYFVGIGGIGMSALALYFAKGGFEIAGYDRSRNSITDSLKDEGCEITFDDDINHLPQLFTDPEKQSSVIVVYTPAIPKENLILSFFLDNGYRIYKRSEILGEISSNTDTLAVAGTHGKTTVSTMIAHLLKQSHVDCSAFLGGISKNYNTNLLIGDSRYTVMEADEFDRSFHRLSPLMAVVTSLDADHLDIYGNKDKMIEAYSEFCSRIRPGGNLLINRKIQGSLLVPENVSCYTYGIDTDADYCACDIKRIGDYYSFSIRTPFGIIEDLHFPFPGIINIENLTAAIAISLLSGVSEDEIRKAIILFQGVKRRFDIRINRPDLVYIDDYAHHPEEISAFISSVKEYYHGRRITGIFQPHLFTRTRDHAAGFASSLDKLDEVIILPVYPAREKPIEGVTSNMIIDKMTLEKKSLMRKEDIPDKLVISELDVLVTIGAGDIDTLVSPIEMKIKEFKAV